MKSAAVIVAGGRGKRFGGRVRKQYLQLRGHPLAWWSIKAFEAAPSIRWIVLVVPAEDIPIVKGKLKTWKISKPVLVVPGGKERSDSVRNGLAAVPPDVSWIAVHDAARPLITVDVIERTLKAARPTGAALVAAPSRDTVKLTDNGQWVRATPPRETVWLAQTPQCFAKSLLERAYRKNKARKPTDDTQLVEWLGVKVKLMKNDSENIKVTVPSDLLIADILLKQRRTPHPVRLSPSPKWRGMAQVLA